MDGSDRAPTGLARRRQRISDEETERRMLQAAVAQVTSTGLTVSLEHLSLEDIIRDAEVSRSAVYRRWPYKDLFFSDLLRELAGAAGSGGLPNDTMAAEIIRSVARERMDCVETSELRHELLLEIVRRSAPGNFRFFHESTQWRTYLALHATFLSLPAGELRDDVQAALTRSEQAVVAQIAASYEYVAGLFGYRLRPELGATFETMAHLLNATMRGMVLVAPSVPGIAGGTVDARPFGAGVEKEWSEPGLGIVSITMSFLEPDPAVEWDDERVTTLREALRELTMPSASG